MPVEEQIQRARDVVEDKPAEELHDLVAELFAQPAVASSGQSVAASSFMSLAAGRSTDYQRPQRGLTLATHGNSNVSARRPEPDDPQSRRLYLDRRRPAPGRLQAVRVRQGGPPAHGHPSIGLRP